MTQKTAALQGEMTRRTQPEGGLQTLARQKSSPEGWTDITTGDRARGAREPVVGIPPKPVPGGRDRKTETQSVLQTENAG
jgi:hypothetical protein